MTAAAPPEPTPDGKDWTWVLDRPCPDCGLRAGAVPLADVPDRLRSTSREIAATLGDARAVQRPTPTTWSALEYACHVRDCCDLYLHRLGLMLDQDDPSFPDWDQDETALAERYDLQAPAVVADEVVAAADRLAHAFEDVAGDQWERTGHRSDGADFTVASFARYFLHDPVHHLWDIRTGLARPDAASG